MDYEICFLVCGNCASALGLQKAVGCFFMRRKWIVLFLRACARTRARMPVTWWHTRWSRAASRSHTRFCFCTAITDIIPYYKGYKGQQKWGASSWFFENCSFFQSYIQAFFIRSYGNICGLLSGRALKRHTDTWRSGSGSASHCGGIPLPDKTAWECIFQSRQPLLSPASGVDVGGPPLCWYPCNSSRISDNGSDCLTSGHHRRQVLKRSQIQS